MGKFGAVLIAKVTWILKGDNEFEEWNEGTSRERTMVCDLLATRPAVIIDRRTVRWRLGGGCAGLVTLGKTAGKATIADEVHGSGASSASSAKRREPGSLRLSVCVVYSTRGRHLHSNQAQKWRCGTDGRMAFQDCCMISDRLICGMSRRPAQEQGMKMACIHVTKPLADIGLSTRPSLKHQSLAREGRSKPHHPRHAATSAASSERPFSPPTRPH